MVFYEESFWTPLSRPTVFGLSLCMVIVSIILVPFYLVLNNVLRNNLLFKKNVFYFILSNIAMIDIAYIYGISMAAMMSLKHERLFPLLYEICSAIHAVYEWTLHLFCLMLALKIVILTFDLEMKYTSKVLKFLTLFIWKALFINLHVNDAAKIEFTYTFEVITFSVDLKNQYSRRVAQLWFYLNLGFIIATFMCYVLIIVYQMLKKINKVSAKPFEECQLLCVKQGLITYVPVAIYFIVNATLAGEVPKATAALSAFASLLPRFIPVCHFAGFLVVNSELRCAFLTSIRNFFPCCRRKHCDVQSIDLKACDSVKSDRN